MHLTEEEIPNGVLIVSLSKHLTCVKDKVIYDTYDCSEKTYYDRESGEFMTNDTRAVYNYWTAPTKQDIENREHVNNLINKQKECIEQTKIKVNKIKDKYNDEIKQLKRKIRSLERKRDKEINKIKEQDGKAFCDMVLEGE